jgi:DtxR family transcriptional regulator, Mn-dependent transcriptional regulator
MPSRSKVHPNSESIDNYLKAILALGGAEERRVTGKELSDYLQVAPASVTNMLQKLSASPEPPVDYELHRGVRLSPAGTRRALEILRHHRLIETFLYEVLDYPLEEVHDEAERLEHFISERFEERIAAKLRHPKIDPHGHCIPELDGRMPRRSAVVLSEVAGDGPFLVDSVEDRDSQTLKLLRTSGIRPGQRLQVRSRSAAGHVKVKVGNRSVDLAPRLAGAVRVRSGQ